MKKISEIYNWQRLTPDDGHYFFGYYDRNPWNADQSLHLMMKINQCERLPLPGEKAEIGAVTINGQWRKYTETRAWCHQQGCMELFYPNSCNRFIYNDFNITTKQLNAIIFQIDKGITGAYSCPIYALTPNGKFAISLDIGRIPRRGYSYADTPVSQELLPKHPDEEGIFTLNLENGEKRLIASYQDMLACHPYAFSAKNRYLWLNHAIVNCDSTRILWLLRQTENQHCVNGWQTFMYTCDINGKNLKCVLPEVYWTKQISHQIWGRTPHEILVDANWDKVGHHAVVLNDDQFPFISKKLADSHGKMAHMVFSSDGKFIVADSYPDSEQVQTLSLIEVATGKMEILGRFSHQMKQPTIGETRCNLHPRWSPDGRFITVDSIHDGKFRGTYLLKR